MIAVKTATINTSTLPQSAPAPWRRWWPAALVLLVLVSGAGFLLLPLLKGPKRDIGPYVTKVSQGSLAGIITASGEIEAEQRVNVSPKRQGQLLALYVDEGDQVVAGQPLARMDPSDIRNRLEELRAQQAVARVDLNRSRGEYGGKPGY